MGQNHSICDYHNKPLRQDKRVFYREDSLNPTPEAKKAMDDFFNTAVRRDAQDAGPDGRDSIEFANIQMTQDFHWHVSNNLPRGSLLLNNKTELTQRVLTERKGQNFLNVKQACAIGSNQMNLTQEYSFSHHKTTQSHQLPESTRASARGDSMIFGKAPTGLSRKSKKIKQFSRDPNFGFDKKKQKLLHPYKIYQTMKKDIGCDFAPNVLKGKFLYQGDLVDGLRHGSGKLYYTEMLARNILEKTDCNVDCNGNWLLCFKPILIYSGQFMCDTIHCKNGKIFHPLTSKLYYEGGIFLGRKQGSGKLFDFDGDLLYKGKFCDDIPNDDIDGKIYFKENAIYTQTNPKENAIYTKPNPKENAMISYAGRIREGKRSGKGVEYCGDSDSGVVTFKGEFYEDFRHGRGIELAGEFDVKNSLTLDVKAVGVWEYGRRVRKEGFMTGGNSMTVDDMGVLGTDCTWD